MSALPVGWSELPLAEICKVSYGKALAKEARSSTGPFHYVGSGGSIARTDDPLVRSETIVVGRKGTAWSVQRYPNGCWPSDTTFYLEVPGELDGQLIEHQLRAAQLGQHDRSTALPGLGRPDLERTGIRVPPRSEQERIVTAIEEAFSKLDAGEVALRATRQRLKRLRESVLAAAVTGRLVPQDPTDEPAARLLADSGVSQRRAELNLTMPRSWATATVGDLISEPLSNGRSVQTADGGFPVLRLTCLRDGKIDLAERKLGAWDANEAAGFLVERGDFFVSRGNGSLRLVGRGGLVDVDPDPVAYPDTLIRIRIPASAMAPKLLSIWWNARVVRDQLEAQARTTAGIYKVNQGMIATVFLPVPGRVEQDRIVSELERQFSFIDACERTIAVGLARSAALRRSILKSAFEGRLVSQDPTNETAAALLDRIRAERDAAGKARKPGRTSKAASST